MRRLFPLSALATLLIALAAPALAAAYSHFSLVGFDISPGMSVPNGHTLQFDLPQQPTPDFLDPGCGTPACAPTFGFYNIPVVEDGAAKTASVLAFGIDAGFFFAGGLSGNWTLFSGGALAVGPLATPTFLNVSYFFNGDLVTYGAQITITSSNVIPEPGSLALLGAGLLGLVALRPRPRRPARARATGGA